MQEFGRAGRDGEPVVAHFLISKCEDLKKLKYWTIDCASIEKKTFDLTTSSTSVSICERSIGVACENISTNILKKNGYRLQQEIPMSAVLGVKSRVPSP